ncbi:unnamed protein product [Ectocarpus sp. 6 AP-2014]
MVGVDRLVLGSCVLVARRRGYTLTRTIRGARVHQKRSRATRGGGATCAKVGNKHQAGEALLCPCFSHCRRHRQTCDCRRARVRYIASNHTTGSPHSAASRRWSDLCQHSAINSNHEQGLSCLDLRG